MSESWSGKVPANSKSGQDTKIALKEGDRITVTATGKMSLWGNDDTCGPSGDPAQNSGLVCSTAYGGALIANINGKYYPINDGVDQWHVPNDGELIFVVNDRAADYSDNSGGFDVEMKKVPANAIKKGRECFQMPANTDFGLIAVANSASTQSIRVLIDGDEKDKFTLKGRKDAGNGVKFYNSGSKGEVCIDISVNGQPSEIQKKPATIGGSNFRVFGSEDGTDGDYNDTIVMINWPLG